MTNLTEPISDMTPLTGLRVLDFSHVIAGPFATLYLAQLGAEVTKVEKPGGGDVMRASPVGAYQFASFNAGKNCIEIDLRSAEGRAEALRLAAQCDVLVDNFRPGGRVHQRSQSQQRSQTGRLVLGKHSDANARHGLDHNPLIKNTA